MLRLGRPDLPLLFLHSAESGQSVLKTRLHAPRICHDEYWSLKQVDSWCTFQCTVMVGYKDKYLKNILKHWWNFKHKFNFNEMERTKKHFTFVKINSEDFEAWDILERVMTEWWRKTLRPGDASQKLSSLWKTSIKLKWKRPEDYQWALFCRFR